MIGTNIIASSLVETAAHSNFDHTNHSADSITNLTKTTYSEIEKFVKEDPATPEEAKVLDFMQKQELQTVEASAKFLAGAVYLFKHGHTEEADLLKILGASVDEPAKAVFMGAIGHVLCNMKKAAENPSLIGQSLHIAADARNFSYGKYDPKAIEEDVKKGASNVINNWGSEKTKQQIIQDLNKLDMGNIHHAAKFAGCLDKALDKEIFDKRNLKDVLGVLGCMQPNAVFGGTIAWILFNDK